MVNISEAEAPLCYTNAFTAERGYSSGIWFTAMQAVRRQEGMARGSSNEGDATVSYLTIGFNQLASTIKRFSKGWHKAGSEGSAYQIRGYLPIAATAGKGR